MIAALPKASIDKSEGRNDKEFRNRVKDRRVWENRTKDRQVVERKLLNTFSKRCAHRAHQLQSLSIMHLDCPDPGGSDVGSLVG